ncbi:hypothetical protein AAFF_G00311090 [Aldrovandia affinis]|uniref:Protein phosphatase 1 regulatory subunit 16B n=1 Tax=Aldrovandia affinis TaxID=143900 RepID=A0AAD7R8C1_9TELE|nr:hypothetical protein AAFF_G00311090 [Aldrovandia affinis]
MASHRELVEELQHMERAPSLHRMRAAQKRRSQQLKRWAAHEKDASGRKRKADKRHGPAHSPAAKHVSFTASVALLEAASRNDSEEVRYLLGNGVSPDLCTEDGLTALHQCCIDNHEDMVKTLLAGGANVNARDNELWTPLHAAATCSHTGLTHTLIQHGADLLAVNSDGNMPYDLCEDDSVLDIIETSMANCGITQGMINEMRASLEQRMLGDVQRLLRDGEDVNLHDSQGVTLLHIAAAGGYVEVVELLLQGEGQSSGTETDGNLSTLQPAGASLNARTCLDETPIDLCEDEEFRALLLDLKYKHDVMMRSQLRQKAPLCRRSSSTGSRGKLVRRSSLSDRTSLYRREYETEAILWMGGRGEEEDDEEGDTGQEDSQSANGRDSPSEEGGIRNGHLVSVATAAPAHPPCVGEPPGPPLPEGPWSGGCGLTLFELKKQRAAAAKLLGQARLNGSPGSSDSRMPLVSANGSAVYYTPASGDPPLLRLKQPKEELEVKGHGCCCMS